MLSCSSKRRQLSWTAIAVISIALVASCSYRIWASWQIRKELAKLEASGEPTDFGQLDKLYPDVPSSENAALLYSQAFARINHDANERFKELMDSIEAMDDDTPLSSSNKAAISIELRKHAPALQLLHNATKLKQARYPISFRKGPNTDVEHLSGVEVSVRVLALEALLAAEQGDAAAAIRSLRAILALGASISREPQLRSHAYRFFCNHTAFYLVPRVLHKAKPSASGLADLQDYFHLASQPVDLGPAFRAERCFRLRLNEKAYLRLMFDTDRESRVSVEILSPVLTALGRYEGDQLFYLENIHPFIQASSKPFDERIRLIGEQSDRLYRRGKRQLYFVSTLLFIDYEPYVRGDIESAARLRVALTTLAVERFRRDNNGDLPASLDHVVTRYLKEPPVDPFDDKGIKFSDRSTHYAVYSLGRDRVDNRGRRLRRGENATRPHDLVLQVKK